MKWAVYAAQVLTGIAGIGAVLVADEITRLHILVAAVLAASIAVSLLVVARAEADAERDRAHLDTLLRAMELPFFIIEAVSKVVDAVARKRGWQWTQQENFERETVYRFRSTDGQLGRLVIGEQEFKDLWILDEGERTKAIEARLFGTGQGTASDAAMAYAGAAIREAIAEHVSGPHWVSQPADAGGARRYEVRLQQHATPIKTLVLTKARVDELLAMLPIRRYQELAEEVDRVFSANS